LSIFFLFKLECLTWLIVKFDKYLFLIYILVMKYFICTLNLVYDVFFFFLLLYVAKYTKCKKNKKCVLEKTQVSNSDVPEYTALLIFRQ
jgi:hypothetical protein